MSSPAPCRNTPVLIWSDLTTYVSPSWRNTPVLIDALSSDGSAYKKLESSTTTPFAGLVRRRTLTLSTLLTNSKWFIIVIYAIFGCPLSYMLWYRPLYHTMRFLFNLFQVSIIIEQQFMDMQILNLILWCPQNWKCGNLRPVLHFLYFRSLNFLALHLITRTTNRLRNFFS
jgi:hypothetical protein